VLLCWLITSARGGARAADNPLTGDAHGEAHIAGKPPHHDAHGEAGIADTVTATGARGEARIADLRGFRSARGEADVSDVAQTIVSDSQKRSDAHGEAGISGKADARGEVAKSPTTAHRGHLVLFATTIGLLGVYAAVMYWWWDLPAGRDWWIRQNAVQLRRVLGLQRSGGTLTSPFAALHLLLAQYRVFAPSFVIAVCAFTLGVILLARCWRARSWAQLQPDALLWSWMAAGVVVFGSSSLRFPQYFALILVPMYLFWWSAVWRSQAATRTKLAAVGAAVVLGIVSFWLRVPTQNGNPFRDVQVYAARSMPAGAVVVTEEAIGDLIGQRWCRVEQPSACAGVASYAITWRTYLQSSFILGGAPFAKIMRGAVPVRSWTGFSGTATVWRLQR
jgi:hypothetical protein